ncbi:FRG domain protein [uncultured Actinomyces sp.]|nr:FRG domain protein [uncultured Actinomyces sp.]
MIVANTPTSEIRAQPERAQPVNTLADKFFTERELIVNFNDTSESREENARAWYEAVKETISTLPIYQHDNVGQSPDDRKTNKSDEENNERTKANSQTESDVWFFRGQKDARFAFNSTLYRRLLHASDDNLLAKRPREHENAMLKAELSLLKKAREIGIGRGLTALETLTLLQHHGSPTRLIDITSDWKVSLFFACESDDDRDGRVFFIKTNANTWQGFPKEPDTGQQAVHPVWQNYREKFSETGGLVPRYSWLSGTWPILLPFSDPRMISQRGFFLVGGVPSPKGASNLYTSKCPDCGMRFCKCPGSEVIPRSETSSSEQTRKFDSGLNTQELREITSLTIRFGADIKHFHQIKRAKYNDWSAVGYSIRVPKHYKRTLRQILKEDHVHTDLIYPPLRETVRLFEHVVSESLK